MTAYHRYLDGVYGTTCGGLGRGDVAFELTGVIRVLTGVAGRLVVYPLSPTGTLTVCDTDWPWKEEVGAVVIVVVMVAMGCNGTGTLAVAPLFGSLSRWR